MFGNPLYVIGAAHYYPCINSTWAITSVPQNSWQVFPDILIHDISLGLNRSFNSDNQTYSYHGIVQGSVDFGVSSVTTIEINDSVLSMTLNFNYTNDYISTQSLLHFASGCSADNGPIAKGNGTISLNKIADNSNITGDVDLSYFGANCSTTSVLWKLHGHASTAGVEVYGAALSSNLNITVTRFLNSSVGGEVSGGFIEYDGVHAQADVLFDSDRGLYAMFINVLYERPNLFNLSAYLNYSKSCSGDFGLATVTVVALPSEPVLILNGTLLYFFE